MSTHTTNAIVQTSKLVALGDAIRAKTGGSAEMTVDEMATAIASIPSGEVAKKQKQINFIDYDGTIVESYTRTEWASVSALPANPTHAGLTAQGWNWTKAQIDTQLNALPDGDVCVGQTYVTTSGATEIDISLNNAEYLSPYLKIAVKGTITIDWGDGSSTQTLTGSSLTTAKYGTHTYQSIGNYTIKLTVNNGNFGFYNESNSYPALLIATSGTSYRRYDRSYCKSVTAVRLGTSVSIGQGAFCYCYSMQTITIPNTITSIGTYAFYSCQSLKSITFPSVCTTIGGSSFPSCRSMQLISLPSGVTSIGNSAFQNCYSMSSITIPYGITSISNGAFYQCLSLQSVYIPNGVTSIGSNGFSHCDLIQTMGLPSTITNINDGTFYFCNSLRHIVIPNGVTSIGSNALSNCPALPSITIPDSVSSIGNTAFASCYAIKEYHFLSTTPPTLGTNAFQNIVSGTKIYVPSASLSAYQSAANWSTYASYIEGE